jgi:tRNA wybutosine-synthesizing protein 2
MAFLERLQERLEGKLSDKELALLPKGYQIIGRILLIKLDKRLVRRRKLIGKAILEVLPYLHTVCLQKDISEDIRKPKVEVIAGCKNTQTVNTEHFCKFMLDVSDIMWSQGNKEEKMRLVRLARPGETVVDMFSGIGYWSILLAKHCKAKVYAIDVNPRAIEFLRKNAWLNHVENQVEILEGDCRKYAKALEGVADRVIMGYLFETEKFLPYAFRMIKDGAIIHFHRNVDEREVEKVKEMIAKTARKGKVKVKILSSRRIKSYAPKVWHMVFDLQVKKQS